MATARAAMSTPTRRESVLARLLNPAVGFPLLWVLGVAAAQFELFSFQDGAWSSRTWVVMALVPIAFVLGSLIGTSLWREPAAAPAQRPERRSRRRALLLATACVGTLELLHQVISLGTVPLLASDIDTARLALPGGPTVVLMNGLPIAAALAIVLPPRLNLRETRFEIGLAAICMLLALAAGGRGLAVLAVGVALLGRTLRWGAPSWRFLASAGAIAVLALVVLFYVRARQNAGNAFEIELYAVVAETPPALRFLIPLHIALTSNFEALAAIVDHFPDRQRYGRGAFSAVGFDLVVPGSRPLTAVSERLTSPFVTSTGAGTLWADGGAALVVLGMAATGALSAALRRGAQVTGRLALMLPAAYIAYLAFFGVYTNLFTQHPDWVVVAPMLAGIGWLLDTSRESIVIQLQGLGYRSRHAVRRCAERLMVRRSLAIGIALVLLGLVAAVGVVVSREPVTVEDADPLQSRARTPAIPPAARDLGTVSDKALDNEPLWAFERSGKTLRATPVSMTDAPPAPLPASVTLRRPLKEGAVVDVGPWVGDSQAIFVLEKSSRDVRVAVYSTSLGKEVAVGRAVEPSQLPGGTRDVFIATWDGRIVDLFILDRGVRGERARLAIYRGEEIFSGRVGHIQLPLVELSADTWAVDVGTVAGDKPDLLLFTSEGASGGPEMHVLQGESNFQTFQLQNRVTGFSSSDEATPRVLAGSIGSAPTAFAELDGKWRSIRIGEPAVIQPGG